MDRPTFPIEVVNEYRQGYRQYDLCPDWTDETFGVYDVGEYIYVRHFSIRVGLIVERGYFQCYADHGKTVSDGILAKYRVRLLNNDGTFAKRDQWVMPGAIHRAYECSYNDETGEKRSFPPFMIEAFLKELRKW